MLTELSIRDIALIPRLHLRFEPGLNVLSGETGAGKSLIVGSLRLLCGAKPPPGFVRAGAERGVVEGIFDIEPTGWLGRELSTLGVDLEDGELILRREIAAEGKGRVRANGQAIPLATLSRVSELLIDLHGQHDHQSLLRAPRQLDALDEVGGTLEEADTFGKLLQEWRRTNSDVEEAQAVFREDRERQELARLQLRELDGADVRPGERAEILAEKARLEQAATLRETARTIAYRLDEADDAYQQGLAELAEAAAEAARFDAPWSTVAEGLSRLAIDAAELAREAHRLGDRAVEDPERLVEVQDRVRLIDELLLRHGPQEADLLAARERLRREHGDPEARERRLRALEAQLKGISDKLADRGSRLTRRRRKAAGELRTAVETALASLGMAGTTFETRLEPRRTGDAILEGSPLRAGVSGLDIAEFLLAPNAGEEVRPLRTVASGGEISRVMLALKSVVGEVRGTATMVFDEIDAGVGGTVATRVAETLARIAERRQVLCITHLAAIAAAARHHVRVHKEKSGKRTVTRVEAVEGEERVLEIARMLGGADPEGVALEHARELLTKERP